MTGLMVVFKMVTGFGGNGITPIMLASWTDFMIAEIA